MSPQQSPEQRGNGLWYLVLLLPFVALLWPWYLRAEPSLGGFPFFYWYQLAWVLVSALLTWLVYRAVFGGRA